MAEPLIDALHAAIAEAFPGARIQVDGGGGHFSIEVVSDRFEGKSILQKQQLVYKAITPLMAGANAPVHAIDKLVCRTP